MYYQPQEDKMDDLKISHVVGSLWEKNYSEIETSKPEYTLS